MTTAHPTPAGWYPDPEGPQNLRYWDGRNWTSHTQDPLATPSGPGAQTFSPPRSSLSLSVAVRVLLAVAGLASLVGAGVEIWGFRLLAGGVRDPLSINLDSYALYDQLHSASALIGSGCVVITGVVWIIWQSGLAFRAPRVALRRAPGWHIAAWFVPVVSLWFPVQHLADLRGALDGARSPSRIPGGYLVWWLFWLGGSAATIVAVQLSLRDPSLSALADSTAVEALSDLLNSLAAGLAILVVRDLNSRVRAILNPVGAAAGNQAVVEQG